MNFAWGTRTYLMGVINVTPDSFSGDGVLKENDWVPAAVEQGVRMESEGADILDVGGESTRPGATPVSLEDELSRVIPVITALSNAVTIPLSIDTYKAEVARLAIEAGARMVNDVWAFRKDAAMAHVVARSGVPVVLMHNRSGEHATSAGLGARFVATHYEDLLRNISAGLRTSADEALAAGIKKENIILDPGIGFGKTVEQNLELVRRFAEFKNLGFPLLAGPSRKSFVGYTLNLPPEERLEGTAAATTLLIERGADIIRVHDVAAMKRVATLTDAIVR